MRLEVSGSGFPPLQSGGFLTDEDMTTSVVEELVQNLYGEFTSSIVGGRTVLAVEAPYSLTAALS